MSQQPPANLPDKPPGEWGTDDQGTSESAPKSWTPLVESFQKAVPPQDVALAPGLTWPVYVKDVGRGRLEWSTGDGEILTLDAQKLILGSTTSDEDQLSGSYADLAKDYGDIHYVSILDDMPPDVAASIRNAYEESGKKMTMYPVLPEIAPCPFCKSTTVALVYHLSDLYVQCHDCGATGPGIRNRDQDSRKQAIDQWATSQPLGSEKFDIIDPNESLIESHGYTSYLNDDEKERDPTVQQARECLKMLTQLVDRLIAAGDNLLSEHAQETDHFVIAIREYQAAIRELLK